MHESLNGRLSGGVAKCLRMQGKCLYSVSYTHLMLLLSAGATTVVAQDASNCNSNSSISHEAVRAGNFKDCLLYTSNLYLKSISRQSGRKVYMPRGNMGSHVIPAIRKSIA